MAIFSLLATFSATFAWFVANRKTTDSVDSFEVVAKHGKFNRVSFHTLASKTIRDSYYESTFNFNKSEYGSLTYDWETESFVPDKNTNLSLVGYDNLDHEQPVLMLVELDKEYDSATDSTVKINLTLNNDAPGVFIGERNESQENAYNLSDSTLIYGTGTEIRNNKEITVNYYGLSNAAKFHVIQYSANDFNAAFDSSDNYSFTHLDNQKSFVNITHTSNDSNSSTSDSSTYSNKITPLIETSGKAKYIAIIVDYYSDAIEYTYSTFLGDTTLEETYEGFLYYKCDWFMEVI